MKDWKNVDKLKVIEGYREPGSKKFDSSADSISSIKVQSGVEARVNFKNGVNRFYPWHRILNYED